MLGFGKGNINIVLEKTNFGYGETVSGRATMTLKKIVNARGVNVILFAERKVNDGDGGTRTQRTYEQVINLDKEQEYPAKDYLYDFKLQLPYDNKANVEGKVGAVLNAFNALGKMMSPLKWYVEVKLDIPKGFDVSKRIQISVA